MNPYNNPDAVNAPDDGKVPVNDVVEDWQTKLCDLTLVEWDRGRQYVDDLNDVYEDLYKMLRGIRPEKNYDWQSNVVINKVFQIVWTAIPYLTQKIFGATPIMGVKAFDKKGAWQREEILEFWHTMQPANSSKHISFFLVTVMWTLRALLNGVGILKKTWRQDLKRTSTTIEVPVDMDANGQVLRTEKKTTTSTIPIEDWPYNLVVNNRDIVVDWLLEPGQSIRQGRFIIHRSMTDLGELWDSPINYINLDDINPKQSMTDSKLRQDASDVKNVDQQESTPESDIYTDVEIYERVGKYAIYKTKEDGQWIPCFDRDEIYDSDDVVTKEMVLTVSKGEKNVLIRFDENRYNEINYLDLHIYLDAERWQSMGMVEPIKDLQTAVNDNINAMFDEINQNLMPPVIIDKFALWDFDTMQYAPQQRWMVGGNPANAIMFKESSNITSDAWQKHLMLGGEIDLTSAVNPPMQGLGKEKAATTNVLNVQMSAGKLDFIIKMIEQTGLIPSAQMDIRFAKKFAHPMTFQMILGEPFQFAEWEEVYKYVPAAASVKLEYQKDQETMQDTILIQTVGAIQNPGVPKIINVLLANIFRNRGWPQLAEMLDEDFYEPSSEAGNMNMLNQMLGGATSNQAQLPMTTPEKGTRRMTYEPRR